MLNTVVPSVKGQALRLAHSAMEASFRCWRTDSESPTGLSDVRLATRAASSPAGSVLPEPHNNHHSNIGLKTWDYFTFKQPRYNDKFLKDGQGTLYTSL